LLQAQEIRARKDSSYQEFNNKMPTRLPSSIKITFPVNNLINANEISKACFL